MSEPLSPHRGAAGNRVSFTPPRGWIERLVRCAILAPSCHNTQPWQFLLSWEHAELWADRSRQLHICDPHGRELVISCGAALMNLRVACHRFGRESAVTLLPDPDEPNLLAMAGCGPDRPANAEDQRLFDAMFRRRTYRRPFEPKPVADALVGRLVAAAEREGAWLVPVVGAAKRDLGDLVAEATRHQYQDRLFRAELASWVRPSTGRPDGIPGYAFGFGTLTARLAPWVLRGFDIGGTQAARDRALVAGSPLIAVLGSDRDTRRHWLRAGQALERVLLSATSEGLSASYLNAPVQSERFRPHLAELIGASGMPQLVLRFGFAGSLRPTPRRPLADVIKPVA